MSPKPKKASTATSSTTEQQALSVWRTTVKSLYAAANTQRKNKGGVITVQKLIHNRFNEPYRIVDVNNNALSLEDIPDNLVSVVHKLEDYENTGYSYILEDMKDLLNNPTAENLKACRAKVDYILSAKDKAVS